MAYDGGMADVSAKKVTLRTAKAGSSIALGGEAFQILRQGTCIKGDVLATVKVAAIIEDFISERPQQVCRPKPARPAVSLAATR